MSKKSYSILAVAVAGSLSLAACGGSSDKDKGSSEGGGKGGTLYYLSTTGTENMDPQRVYVGRDINDWGRLWSRSLVQMPVTDDKSKADKPVADLATDTGKMTDGGKTWSFTLKKGVKWEDGKDITCEDVKYGVSRTFATDQIVDGPTYALTALDLPQKDGQPLYDGPYKKDHQADFDKAVSCSGQTITYKFNKAFPDFPLAIAQLRAFDPVRKDKDKGAQSNLVPFSSGPYKLEGTWKKDIGGTFVRNPNYDASTDGVRKALPDKIVFQEGLETTTIAQRLAADSGKDKFAVTAENIPPSSYAQVTGKVKDRTVNEVSPFVDYVLPNMQSPIFKDKKVREALLAATDQKAWITAGGGDNAYLPAYSIVNESITSAYAKNPAFKYGPTGDVEAAKKLLQEAGQTNPSITFTYRTKGGTEDKQAQALAQGWEKAGFKVKLNSISKGYYGIIRKPNAEGDVFWGGWGPDWAAASTVLPPLFDSRMNLTKDSKGSDYGAYKSDDFNKLVDEAAAKTSVDEAGAVYRKADAKLGEDVAYIPVDVKKFYWSYGSKVKNYINNPAMSMYPDLGSIGLDN